MKVMRGRAGVRERFGVNVSTVFRHIGGERAPGRPWRRAKGIPGHDEDPRFWHLVRHQLVAHMQNPIAPAVHMETPGMFWTPMQLVWRRVRFETPGIEYAEDQRRIPFAVPKSASGPATGAILPASEGMGGRVTSTSRTRHAPRGGGIFMG